MIPSYESLVPPDLLASCVFASLWPDDLRGRTRSGSNLSGFVRVNQESIKPGPFVALASPDRTEQEFTIRGSRTAASQRGRQNATTDVVQRNSRAEQRSTRRGQAPGRRLRTRNSSPVYRKLDRAAHLESRSSGSRPRKPNVARTDGYSREGSGEHDPRPHRGPAGVQPGPSRTISHCRPEAARPDPQALAGCTFSKKGETGGLVPAPRRFRVRETRDPRSRFPWPHGSS
jgi:hypothetical protein